MRVILADVRPQAVDTALTTLGAGDRARGLVLDVTDRSAMQAAADQAEAMFGPIHVLCNNAGIGMIGGVRR